MNSAIRKLGQTLLMLGLLGGVYPLIAGEIVNLINGQSLRVASVHPVGNQVELRFEGGSSMLVPAERIQGWYVESRPVTSKQSPLVSHTDGAWRQRAGQYAPMIESAARRYDLHPALLTSMAEVESAFNPRAVSPKGAMGLMQLMPATAKRFGVQDAFDVVQNVNAGAQYMDWLLDRFGQADLALAGYNAGEGVVDRYKDVPPYPETKNYVAKVLNGVDRLGGSRENLRMKR